jgi:hypothetical protein
MVTRTQLDRLATRIESLAVPGRDERYAVIFINPGETEDAAKLRHFRDHPDDRAVSQRILVHFVAARNGKPADLGDAEGSSNDQ